MNELIYFPHEEYCIRLLSRDYSGAKRVLDETYERVYNLSKKAHNENDKKLAMNAMSKLQEKSFKLNKLIIIQKSKRRTE